MKLSVEIQGDVFKYEYEIGSSKESGSMPLSTDGLGAFYQAVSLCAGHHARALNERATTMIAAAMMQAKNGQ